MANVRKHSVYLVVGKPLDQMDQLVAVRRQPASLGASPRKLVNLQDNWGVIVDPSGTLALSNLGWVDRGSLWLFDSVRQESRQIRLGAASFLRLQAEPQSDLVTVFHGLEGRATISLHRWDALAGVPVATVDLRGWEPQVSGDLGARRAPSSTHVAYLDENAPGAGGYYLIEISPEAASVRRLDWFDDEKYDHDYQSVMSVLPLPSGALLFGVQRSSELVLCDADSLQVIQEVPLADRGGNPQPFFRGNSSELWVVDYDTVVRLDRDSLRVQDSWRGQGAIDGAGMFLGSPWVPSDGSRVIVPRPG